LRNKLGNNRAECCLKLPSSKLGNRKELKIVKRFEFVARQSAGSEFESPAVHHSFRLI